MKPSILVKLESLSERFEEVQHLLGEPSVLNDQNKFRALTKEYSQLEEVINAFNAYKQAEDDLIAAQEMAQEDDLEMRELAQEEVKAAKINIERLFKSTIILQSILKVFRP